MKYFISTISDVEYTWNEDDKSESLRYVHHTGPVASEYGLGLELAEFCISQNCETPEAVMPFFEENASAYTSNLVFHAPFNELMPHAVEPMLTKVCDVRYGQSYELCEKYGCSKMIVHANFVPSLYWEGWFIDRQTDYWKRFLDSHPGKCIICVENIMESRPFLITEIIKRVDNPRLRMCLDVGHANLHPVSVDDWLTQCAPYISHLHIHNNNGPVSEGHSAAGDLHRGLSNGIIDYESFLHRADELIETGLSASIESPEFEQSCAWLRERGFI